MEGRFKCILHIPSNVKNVSAGLHIYVDTIVLAGDYAQIDSNLMNYLTRVFEIKDLGFIGILPRY